METTTAARIDIFSTGFGLTSIGAGLLALAAVEGVGMFLGKPTLTSGQAAPHVAEVARGDSPFGAASPANPAAEDASLDPREPDAQSAVGAGRGAPKAAQSSIPPASGQLVGLAANQIPNGMVVMRLWSSGRVEAMIATEENVWGEWVAVAPGTSTSMRRPRNPADNPDTNP